MKISELSKETGVSVRSLRYYEQKKLLHPTRLENGYRRFEAYDIEKVKSIQFLLALGLSTDEIYPAISCDNFQKVNNKGCAHSAVSLYSEKLKMIREQIKQFKEKEIYLENIIHFWERELKKEEGRD
ncbi:MerR family transcriptional regulator [Bacillus sp. FSL W7-1360]